MILVCSGWRQLWLALALSACAEGYNATGVDKIAQPEPAGGSPDFKGEACERGQSRQCTCPDGSEGMHLCARDPLSPTLGAWMMTCLNCPEPEPPPPPPTAAGAPGTGPDEQPAGSGGRAAAGRGGSSGTAGRGSTSSGGRGSNAGRGGSGRCNCNQDCFPVGVLACCRDNGSCGCTWAPGAYCL